MKSATQILWESIGKPAAQLACCEHSVEPCWVCGGESSFGVPRDEWMGATFVGQNRVKEPRSTTVCAACVYFCSRTSPVPGRLAKEGKEHGGNFRNYSHLYDAGEYSNASKGEKPAIIKFLRSKRRGEWFAAVAESGQKHVLPWAPVNPAGSRKGLVLFEEMLVQVPSASSHEWALLDHMADLLTAGATKESLGTGQYNPGEWQRCEHAIHAFEARWSHARSSPFWFLALFLAQRDEEQVKLRIEAEKESQKAKKEADSAKKAGRKAKGQASDADRRSPARGKKSVPANPAGEHAKELGHASDANANRNKDVHEPRTVGDADVARTVRGPGSKPQQLSLFTGLGLGNPRG